jgi:hypothetical protein
VNSRVLMFASSLAPDLHINAYLAERLDLKYRASEAVRYLYVKSSRLVSSMWRSSTVLLHDIPRTVDVSMNPVGKFDAGAAPSQMMPEFSIAADQDTLDVFVDLDGRASGQRGSYQVEVKDAGETVTARHTGAVYRLRSTGTEEIYIRARDMPYRKGFSLSAVGIFIENLHSMDLEISTVFGSYPTFRISSLEADSIHLSVRTKISAGSDREGKLVLADSRSSGGLPAGVGLFNNGFTAGQSKDDSHVIVPLPLASILWTLLGG